MDGLTEHTAADWLHARGWLPAAVGARVRTLEWGVSNVVLRVTPGTGADFILKQSRPQLRTPIPWFSRIDRIYREAEALRALREVVPAATVPEVLWEDRPEYVFAMEAAADPHTVWKQELLSGELDR
ncbi:MAG: phosphotransferase, partial [Planctomycetaceae bacterium]